MATSSKGLILLIDGCSASGKSSFKNALMDDPAFSFTYVKRYTTRQRREDDAVNDDYVFVSEAEFEAMVANDEMAEYRHYLFGMAYGLRKTEILEVCGRGDDVLGLMNLGTVDMIRQQLPAARCVLVDAPVADIERRLRTRGSHTEEQIQERLGNARSVDEFRHKYDFVCDNGDGNFDIAYRSLVDFLGQSG